MEMFSPAGIKMAYSITVLSILFLIVLVGKFFYISPFRNWYDYLKKEQLPLILCLVGTVACITMWIGVLTGVEFFAVIGGLCGFLVWGAVLLGAVLCVLVSIVPFMQNLHEKIIEKRTRK